MSRTPPGANTDNYSSSKVASAKMRLMNGSIVRVEGLLRSAACLNVGRPIPWQARSERDIQGKQPVSGSVSYKADDFPSGPTGSRFRSRLAHIIVH